MTPDVGQRRLEVMAHHGGSNNGPLHEQIECRQIDPHELHDGPTEGYDPSDVMPGPRVLNAAWSIGALAQRVGMDGFSDVVPQQVLDHEWSQFKVPLLWAAADDSASHPVLD